MKPHTNLNGVKTRAAYLISSELLLLAILFSAGCAKPVADLNRPASVATETNPVGSYSLISVNGTNVPCTFPHEGQNLAIKSGRFAINPDGTCASYMVFALPNQTESTREVKARYTQQGSTLTMTWDGAGLTTGSVQGDSFTMANEGMLLRYQR